MLTISKGLFYNVLEVLNWRLHFIYRLSFFTSIYISHRDSNIYGLMNTIFLTPGWHIYYILISIENEGSTLIREKEKRKITHHCHYNLLVKNTLT
jgi:hypothetical protein